MCGEIQVPRPAASAAAWQARLSWRSVIGRGIPAREQPALRAALQPPSAQDLKQLPGEHPVPVLAALAQFDADQHPFAVDIVHAQSNNLGGACSFDGLTRRFENQNIRNSPQAEE